jgi:hypothetical protein
MSENLEVLTDHTDTLFHDERTAKQASGFVRSRDSFGQSHQVIGQEGQNANICVDCFVTGSKYSL